MAWPDISNAVCAVERYSHSPGAKQWKAVLKTIGYLRGTRDFGLTFSRRRRLEVLAYADSDYTKSEDRRSMSAIFIGNTNVTWCARIQKCVTVSTTEAEYVAISDCVKEAMFVRHVFNFYEHEENSTVHFSA